MQLILHLCRVSGCCRCILGGPGLLVWSPGILFLSRCYWPVVPQSGEWTKKKETALTAYIKYLIWSLTKYPPAGGSWMQDWEGRAAAPLQLWKFLASCYILNLRESDAILCRQIEIVQDLITVRFPLRWPSFPITGACCLILKTFLIWHSLKLSSHFPF